MMNEKQVNSGKRVVVKIEGDINEWVDYSRMIPAEANRVEILCDGVGRVNSIGLRSWISALREREAAGVGIRFHWVPMQVLAVLRLLAPSLAFSQVQSVQVPLRCEGCGRARLGLVQAGAGVREIKRVQSVRCRCGGAERIDEGREELEALQEFLLRA